MCALCDQISGRRFEIKEFNDHSVLYGLSIAPAELLDSGSVAVTRRATATDGVLDYYLHTPGGAITVSGVGSGNSKFSHLLFLALIKTISRPWFVVLTASLI